jgi:hypothetical protein
LKLFARLPVACVGMSALACLCTANALAQAPAARGSSRVRHVGPAAQLPPSLSLPQIALDHPDLDLAKKSAPRLRTHRSSLHAVPSSLRFLDRADVFPGMASNDSGDHSPPDVAIAAGGGYVVELVNEARRVWSEGGTLLDNATGLTQMFHVGNDNLSDPRIMFDAASGRFIASVMDFTVGNVLIGVSAGANPLGDWNVMTLTAAGGSVCFDQPKIGTSSNVVIVAANSFARSGANCSFIGTSYAGGVLWVLNKQELLAGAPTVHWNSFGPDPNFDSPIAAQAMSATDVAYAASSTDTGITVYAINGTPPGAVGLTQTAPDTIGFGGPPLAVQPSNQPVETNDGRLLDAFWQNGSLWVAGNDYCVNQGVFRACSRVLEVNTDLDSVTYNTWYTFAGRDTFFPALRPDGRGDVVLVTGMSAADTDPAVVADAWNGTTWTGSVFLHAGITPTLDLRWGDYFGAATDPAVPGLVWIGGEYSNGLLWQTAVGAWKTVAVAPYVEPSATTPAVADKAATVSAVVDPRGTDATWWFEYGKTTSYGKSTAPSGAPAAAGAVTVAADLKPLVPGTTYHWRFAARNAGGTTYGADQTLKTTGTAPVAKKPTHKAKPKKKPAS